MLPCDSQSTQWLGSARFSWGFAFFTVSKWFSAVEIEKWFLFCILLCMFGALAWDLCGSQSTQWLGLQGSLCGSPFPVYQLRSMCRV